MKKFNVLTAFFVTALSVVGSATVVAGPMEHGRGAGIERQLKGLDLTDAQRQQIEALTSAFRAKRPEAAEQQRFATELAAIVRADHFDEVAARQLLEQQQGVMVTQGLARLKLQHDIRNILTLEQKEKLDNRVKRMQEKMAEKRSKASTAE